MDATQVTALAQEFEGMLRWHMSAADYREAVDINNNAPDGASCATHDYIDSNESMEAAFQTVMGRPSDVASEDDAALIDAAWAEWRENAADWFNQPEGRE